MGRTLACLAAGTMVWAMVSGCNGTPEGNTYTYTVQEQSTFEEVSRRVYDDPGRADVLREANPEVQGVLLKPGTQLVVPAQKDPQGRYIPPRQCSRANIYN